MRPGNVQEGRGSLGRQRNGGKIIEIGGQGKIIIFAIDGG